MDNMKAKDVIPLNPKQFLGIVFDSLWACFSLQYEGLCFCGIGTTMNRSTENSNCLTGYNAMNHEKENMEVEFLPLFNLQKWN